MLICLVNVCAFSSQAKFAVRDARNPAADFVPLVLNSVSSSMGRSPFFSDDSAAAAAVGKLGRAGDKPSFVTPLLR